MFGSNRIVVHHQQHLALDVGALEIVPAEFGRLYAVTDEHHFSFLDRDALGLRAAAGDVLIPPFERRRFTLALKVHCFGICAVTPTTLIPAARYRRARRARSRCLATAPPGNGAPYRRPA